MPRKKKFPHTDFQVAGKSWRAYFCPNKYMDRKFGKSTMAVSVMEDKEVYFRLKHVSKETAIHEMFHAHLWEHGMHSMDLNANQVEELCAEMFSKRAVNILSSAEDLLSFVEKVREYDKDS